MLRTLPLTFNRGDRCSGDHCWGSSLGIIAGEIVAREIIDLEARSQFEPGQTHEIVDARRNPRYKLEVEICVYPRDCPVVRGYTVDISESGISAMLRVEVPVGEVLRLKFTLPFGDVEVLALVRHQNAFRYGFQFVETSSAQDVIGRTCNQLAVEQSVRRS